MIDVTRYINIARKDTKENAKKLLDAYLLDLATAKEATLEEIKKAYGEYLSQVEPENYNFEMSKNGRLGKLIGNVESILAGVNAKNIENQSKVGTNQYYWMAYLAALLGVSFKDIDPAIYYAIIGRTLDGKVTVDGTTETVDAYLKRVVRDKAKREMIINTYLAKGGDSTIDLIKDLDSVMYTRVEKVIKDAIKRGSSYQQLAKELQKQFDIVANKALTIARTELGRAMSASEYSEWESIKASGIDGYRYLISVLDNGTRNQSQMMDGQRENDEGMFIYPNGKPAKYPGSTGYPQYDINDRETVGYRIDEDTEGTKRASRDIGASQSTSKIKQSFQEWAKSQGIRKSKYGEYYTF